MKSEGVCPSLCIVKLISQQPPAETHCLIPISNGRDGKLFKRLTNCCNGLFSCTSPALSPVPLSFYNLSLLLSHCVIMTCSHPPFSLLFHAHRFVSDSLIRSAFPLNRQKGRMHQLTPTYK